MTVNIENYIKVPIRKFISLFLCFQGLCNSFSNNFLNSLTNSRLKNSLSRIRETNYYHKGKYMDVSTRSFCNVTSYQSNQLASDPYLNLTSLYGEPNPTDSLIDPSVPETRVVRHIDGSVEVIPKSPATVVGERILGPLCHAVFETSSHVYHHLQRGFLHLDKGLSNLFNFIPGASAESQSVPNGNQALVYVDNLKASRVLHQVAIHPEGYSKFCANLSAKNSIKLLKNDTVQDNFQEFHEIFIRLADYITDKASNYNTYKFNLSESCRSLKYLERSLKRIKEDLETNKEKSIFSPTSNRILVLTLPEYSSDFRFKIKESNFYESERHYLASATTRVIAPLLTEADLLEIDQECNENPAEAALLNHLSQLGATLSAFNLKDDFTYEDFVEMFSTQVIKILKSQVIKIQQNLDKGVESVEQIVARVTKDYEKTLQHSMNHKIHLIYTEHQKIINSLSGKQLTVTAQLNDGLVTCWDVKDVGLFYNSLSFRFRVGDAAPLKDEL